MYGDIPLPIPPYLAYQDVKARPRSGAGRIPFIPGCDPCQPFDGILICPDPRMLPMGFYFFLPTSSTSAVRRATMPIPAENPGVDAGVVSVVPASCCA